MTFKPTKKDLEQLQALSLSPERVQQQIDHFKEGFPKSHLDAAATPDNNGIRCFELIFQSCDLLVARPDPA